MRVPVSPGGAPGGHSFTTTGIRALIEQTEHGPAGPCGRREEVTGRGGWRGGTRATSRPSEIAAPNARSHGPEPGPRRDAARRPTQCAATRRRDRGGFPASQRAGAGTRGLRRAFRRGDRTSRGAQRAPTPRQRCTRGRLVQFFSASIHCLGQPANRRAVPEEPGQPCAVHLCSSVFFRGAGRGGQTPPHGVIDGPAAARRPARRPCSFSPASPGTVPTRRG